MNHLKTLVVIFFLSVTMFITPQTKKRIHQELHPKSLQNSVTDVDGNNYKTIKIGTQVWMAENLKVTHYLNGEEIPNITINQEWMNLTTGAWCIYDNDGNYSKTYGNLYNWYAINDARHLAPKGWHVATDAEWTELINYLGGINEAGGKLKEIGTAHWINPNEGATNKTMFSALAGGSRKFNGTFDGIGENGVWWSNLDHNTSDFWYCQRYLSYLNGSIGRYSSNKTDGFSVRCIKDYK